MENHSGLSCTPFISHAFFRDPFLLRDCFWFRHRGWLLRPYLFSGCLLPFARLAPPFARLAPPFAKLALPFARSATPFARSPALFGCWSLFLPLKLELSGSDA